MTEDHSTPIRKREELVGYLRVAMQLEHATIPPYLTALYSINPEPGNQNGASYDIIRAVAVEEMLHLTLAANLLNAIGGAPNLNAPGFVPSYPAYLPDGERDFEVGLQRFSKKTIERFLQIERPRPVELKKKLVPLREICYVRHEHLNHGRERGRGMLPHFITAVKKEDNLKLHFWNIGQFYKAILNGFEDLAEDLGEKELFKGPLKSQVGPEHYYSGGGKIIKVTSLETARAAIDLISGQGEGLDGRIYDADSELSHYYRFDQIHKGRYYREKIDKAGIPTGHAFKVDWKQVFPIIPNAKVAHYAQEPEILKQALIFNWRYKDFLDKLNTALNGDPFLLKPAIVSMHALKQDMIRLMRNPLSSGKGNAAPTFEMDKVEAPDNQDSNHG